MTAIYCKNITINGWQTDWLPLDGGAVHLWKLNLLNFPDTELPTCYSALSPEEQQRADRFRFTVDRKQFVLARYLLRKLLARYSDVPVSQIKLSLDTNRKPFLENNPGDLHFNISHSGDLILIAFRQASKVGVDVERLRMDKNLDSVAATYFSEKERQLITGATDSLPFFRLWTRREALLKAAGAGLVDGLQEVEVCHEFYELSGSSEAVLAMGAGQYFVLSFEPEPGYFGSVALETGAMINDGWENDQGISFARFFNFISSF